MVMKLETVLTQQVEREGVNGEGGAGEYIFFFNVSSSSLPQPYDTIVVGMGSAGTTAASTLARAGRRVLALEAQDRIGGRVKTIPFGDGTVEEGAEWYGLYNTYNNGPGLPNLDIKLNTEVTQIKWPRDASGNVEVVCKDGSTYTASNVIVTVSLGVLKEMINCFRSSWYSNPYVRGAYSYDNLQTPLHPHIRDDLAAPLVDAAGTPRVLFAGEATSRIHFATVHGASETGKREALRLLQTSINV
ncbi:uncharacterized protein LOC126973618 [Leptidea sinapis]|uniref:uncharacterized protein LOC126973618 n=1 Tax=Leptidea sinapis TaxID=189913 RepID=UPI0021C3A316|nr:uncharacterized protein LOC126973618 [Leptidea sinapis]